MAIQYKDAKSSLGRGCTHSARTAPRTFLILARENVGEGAPGRDWGPPFEKGADTGSFPERRHRTQQGRGREDNGASTWAKPSPVSLGGPSKDVQPRLDHRGPLVEVEERRPGAVCPQSYTFCAWAPSLQL
jgi:hypothetical protein